jgi:diguanylate cyclase (GGDEF)-like protein
VNEAESPRDDMPLFVLSFRQRDELAATVANAGWRVVAARRADGAERRLLSSGASVALIDARGALDDGLAATRALAGILAANGGALLVLVSRGDAARLGEFHDAGATHFLASPMREPELIQAIRFAERHVERIAGDWEGRTPGPSDPLGWRYDPEARTLQLTPALARLLDLPESAARRAFLRAFDVADRRLARGALRRLRGDRPSTAFAHELNGVGRVVQHIQHDPRTGRLHALVEPLGVPDATAAVRDALAGARDATGARRWLDRRLGEGTATAVILIALTGFEYVNSAYGRAAGDALLRAVERRIAEAARELLGRNILIARMGGPEFVVAVASDDQARVALAAGRIEETLARPFVAGDSIAPLGARVATVWSAPEETAAALLRRASESLYGGAAPDEAGQVPLERLAGELRRALDEGELRIRFQPQVATATGTIVGVEALARWAHPELGELGAETLFAAGERAGLETVLSEHVQRLALVAAAAWPAVLAPLRLAINITAADVARPGFADLLLDRIDASGFPRGRLTIEITESGLIEELGEAARLLADLRTAGCRVAIDDFGTGYSSLAYLKALPLDYLKIDKKLSQDITGTTRDRVVVRGVIDMARSLGLSVVAEGVETEEQLDLLAKEGCQYYQGFLCAEPLELDALVALVEARAAGR